MPRYRIGNAYYNEKEYAEAKSSQRKLLFTLLGLSLGFWIPFHYLKPYISKMFNYPVSILIAIVITYLLVKFEKAIHSIFEWAIILGFAGLFVWGIYYISK
ncbi:MAG: hypothetical protein R2877_07355 [Bdellovibrionota bacterium]